jgi:large subunit ribosomal protein L25
VHVLASLPLADLRPAAPATLPEGSILISDPDTLVINVTVPAAVDLGESAEAEAAEGAEGEEAAEAADGDAAAEGGEAASDEAAE